MNLLSRSCMAVAIVSFFAEKLIAEPCGFSGILLLTVISCGLPSLINRFWAAPFFCPDVTIAVDPMAPDAKTLAGGIKAAMRLCESENRRIHVLVSRIPGWVARLELNAVRQRCLVEVGLAGGGKTERSQSALPPFTAGAAPACFRLADGGDNLRLVFRPAGDGGRRMSFAPFRVGPLPSALAMLALFLMMLVWVSALAATVGVLVPAGLGLFHDYRHGLSGLGTDTVDWRTDIVVLISASLVVLFNWFRFGVL